jgi:hypothetical protein
MERASLRDRFIRTDLNTADPEWTVHDGKTINEHVQKEVKRFKRVVENVKLNHFQNSVFQKYSDNTIITIGHSRYSDIVAPAPRDLLHVYGPDRDGLKDWKAYYRYAWTQLGPNGIIYSTDDQIIREGKLMCNSYAYSGQGSYAIAGAGMFFRPLFGDAKISIRPYVQWSTSASFTGTESTSAQATANLGIYIESWQLNGGGYFVDKDIWIPVWSQNTQNYLTNTMAGGAATVGDGLSAEILTNTNRKYAIYVYAYLETSAASQQGKNELRFVTLDIDAKVPYVVVEETLL